MTNLINKLKETRKSVDECLNTLLPTEVGLNKRVLDAVRYSLIGGGKALRPFLVLTVAELFSLDRHHALRIGCALEMIHTYSLIHDDLPAMDNDILRRGKPSNHIQFDEATAILAGDALLTHAFDVLSAPQTHPNPEVRCLLVQKLSQLAGINGMIGGQMIDLLGEKIPLSLEEIQQMQSMKTGALLTFACLAPAWAVNASQEQIHALEKYAGCFGVLFQLTDDLLDIEGNQETVGKTLHKDSSAQKSTFVSLLGIEKAKDVAIELHRQAVSALRPFGAKASTLTELADFVLTRRN